MALIHLDAGVVIGFLDGDDAHHDSAREVFVHALHVGDRLAMAASALAECLLGPARRGDPEIQTVRNLIARLPIAIVPLDVAIATRAARLRAGPRSLRLPDALVIATAIEGDADELVTTDAKWPTRGALSLRATVNRL